MVKFDLRAGDQESELTPSYHSTTGLHHTQNITKWRTNAQAQISKVSLHIIVFVLNFFDR